jgi:hypothetical protein
MLKPIEVAGVISIQQTEKQAKKRNLPKKDLLPIFQVHHPIFQTGRFVIYA